MGTQLLLILMTVGCDSPLVVSTAQGAGQKKEERENPDNIRRPVGEKVLKLTKENGFRPLKEVYFLIGPSLQDDPDSYTSLAKINYFKELFDEDVRGNLFIRTIIEDVFKDFFDLICEKPKYWQAIEDLVRDGLKNKPHPLVTITTRFWTDMKFGAEEVSKEFELNCRVELRLFKIRFDPFPEQELGNLGHCELIYCDAAVGKVAVNPLERKPAWAIRAVMIDALKDRLAVNFAMSPRINKDDVIKEPLINREDAVLKELKLDILGLSLSHEERTEP